MVCLHLSSSKVNQKLRITLSSHHRYQHISHIAILIKCCKSPSNSGFTCPPLNLIAPWLPCISFALVLASGCSQDRCLYIWTFIHEKGVSGWHAKERWRLFHFKGFRSILWLRSTDVDFVLLPFCVEDIHVGGINDSKWRSATHSFNVIGASISFLEVFDVDSAVVVLIIKVDLAERSTRTRFKWTSVQTVYLISIRLRTHPILRSRVLTSGNIIAVVWIIFISAAYLFSFAVIVWVLGIFNVW